MTEAPTLALYVQALRARGVLTETRAIRLLCRRFPDIERDQAVNAWGALRTPGLWTVWSGGEHYLSGGFMSEEDWLELRMPPTDRKAR